MNDAPHHDQLPLPDYDHLTVGSLQSRIRSLELADVEQVLAYEKAHGDRLPIVQVLESRLERLRNGGTPSGGDPLADTPEAADQAAGGSKVTPQTEGPAMNPPSHGDPTNPAHPR